MKFVRSVIKKFGQGPFDERNLDIPLFFDIDDERKQIGTLTSLEVIDDENILVTFILNENIDLDREQHLCSISEMKGNGE